MLIPHVAPFLVSSVFTYHRYLNIIVFSVSRLGLVYLVFQFLLLFDFLKPFDETIEGGAKCKFRNNESLVSEIVCPCVKLCVG
jgi:hypothetical protein